MRLQAHIWYAQGSNEEAKSEVLRAADVYGELGSANELEGYRELLRNIEETTKVLVTAGESRSNGELLKTLSLPAPVNSPLLARGTGWLHRLSPRFLRKHPPAGHRHLDPSPRLPRHSSIPLLSSLALCSSFPRASRALPRFSTGDSLQVK